MRIDPQFIQSLKKGDCLTFDVVCSCAAASDALPRLLRDQDKRILALKVAKKIERQLHKIGRIWTLSVGNDFSVQVLTDSDALTYRRRQGRSGVRKVRGCAKGLGGIDTDNLSTTEKVVHDRESTLAASRALALRRHLRNKDPFERIKPTTTEQLAASPKQVRRDPFDRFKQPSQES